MDNIQKACDFAANAKITAPFDSLRDFALDVMDWKDKSKKLQVIKVLSYDDHSINPVVEFHRRYPQVFIIVQNLSKFFFVASDTVPLLQYIRECFNGNEVPFNYLLISNTDY